MTALPPDAREILDKQAFAHIATLLPDGSPQVTPTWIGREGDRILVNTAEGRLKLANMRRDPRIALCALDPDDAYTYVAVQGQVVEITSEDAEDHIDSLAMKYLGRTFPRDRDSDERRIIVRIEPRRVVVVRDA